MKNIRNITKDLIYIGCSDRKIALFENVYPVSDGISYNSYLLNDEKTVLFDTVDKNCSIQFFENLSSALDGKKLDYLVINHLAFLIDISVLSHFIPLCLLSFPSLNILCLF